MFKIWCSIMITSTPLSWCCRTGPIKLLLIALKKYVFSLTLVLRFCACQYRCLTCCFTRQGLATCFASMVRYPSTTSLLKKELTTQHNILFQSIQITGMRKWLQKLVQARFFYYLTYFNIITYLYSEPMCMLLKYDLKINIAWCQFIDCFSITG